MRKLTSREKKIFALVLFTAFFAGVYRFGYLPLKDKSELLTRRIVVEKAKLLKDQKLIKTSEGAVQSAAREIERYRQKISSERVMAAMLQDIEQAAGDLDIDVADLKPQRTRTVDGMNVFSLNLRLNVEFAELAELLSMLQEAPYSFDVEELRIDKSSSRRSQVLNVMVVLRKAYIDEKN